MTKILIVFSSKEGQTQKIASFLNDKISSHKITVDVFDCDSLSSNIPLFNYDGFIIGASVHMGSFSHGVQRWVKDNSFFLKKKPSAFYSVCLGILEKGNNSLISEGHIVTDFFAATEWYPTLWRIFAGALKYSKYNWFVKRIMKRISQKAGFYSDTKHDYEFTDWDDVEVFANQFLDEVMSVKNKEYSRNNNLEKSLE